MADIHILNGDCLANQLVNSVIGKQIVFRECLIEGPISSLSTAMFWRERSRFISNTYNVSEEEYYLRTIKEFNQIFDHVEKSKIYLWFDDDLFCQLNMWFIISQLSESKHSVFRVFPSIKTKNQWDGFSKLNSEELMACLETAVKVSEREMKSIQALWNNLQQQKFTKIHSYQGRCSTVIRHFEAIIQAYTEQITVNRPLKTLQTILNNEKKTFQEVFTEFNKTEGIYGMGDSQVWNILQSANLTHRIV